MNVLIDGAPDCVDVGGVLYPIRTDFRTSIQVEQFAASGAAQTEEGLHHILSLYFERIPEDTQAACHAALWFFSCGETKKSAAQGEAQNKPVYDYDFDAAHIYAAFLSDYGIDLQSVKHLHWWKFRALFDALSPTNTFCKIMEYRSADTRKLKGEERAFYAKMQKLYALPLPETERERIAEAEAWLRGTGVLRVESVE